LLERTVIPTVPVQVLYAPTRRGRELVRALEPLIEWGLREADIADQPTQSSQLTVG